jgi:hypothetical protein
MRPVRDREAPGSNPGPPTITLNSDSRFRAEFGSNSRASRFCAVRGDGVLISKPMAYCSTSCSNPAPQGRRDLELLRRSTYRVQLLHRDTVKATDLNRPLPGLKRPRGV